MRAAAQLLPPDSHSPAPAMGCTWVGLWHLCRPSVTPLGLCGHGLQEPRPSTARSSLQRGAFTKGAGAEHEEQHQHAQTCSSHSHREAGKRKSYQSTPGCFGRSQAMPTFSPAKIVLLGETLLTVLWKSVAQESRESRMHSHSRSFSLPRP